MDCWFIRCSIHQKGKHSSGNILTDEKGVLYRERLLKVYFKILIKKKCKNFVNNFFHRFRDIVLKNHFFFHLIFGVLLFGHFDRIATRLVLTCLSHFSFAIIVSLFFPLFLFHTRFSFYVFPTIFYISSQQLSGQFF